MQDYIEGDLMEVYERRVKQHGKRKADLRFIIDVLLLFRPGIIRPAQGTKYSNNYGMYKSYFKIGWRNLVKDKGYSFINITGFAIGITCVLLAVLYIKDERSFDNFHTNNPHLYRVITTLVENKRDKRMTTGGTGQVQGPAFKEAVPEIRDYVRVMGGDIYGEVIANDKAVSLQILFVDESFFNVFSFRLLYGHAQTALEEVNSAVITESTARKFFNTIDVVGKTLQMDADPSAEKVGKPIVITGVVQDPPKNSSIRFDVLLGMKFIQRSFDDTNWLNAYLGTFVVLHPQSDPLSVAQKFDKVYAVHAKDQLSERKRNNDVDPLISYGLQRITDIHLNPLYAIRGSREAGVVNGSNPVFSYMFLGIGFFILLMAGINFINIRIGRSLERAKEVGIRKISGGSKSQILIQFFAESAILCTTAFGLSIALTQLSLPLFNQLTDKEILLREALDKRLFFYLFIVLAATVLTTGIYPAYVLSGFKPTQVLYRKQRLSGRHLLGKALVVIQFSLAVFLVITTIIYNHQMNYIRVKDLGYNPHQVIRAHIKGNREYRSVQEFLKAELATHPYISLSFGGDRSALEVKIDDHSIDAVHRIIDEHYLPMLEIPLRAGRNFSTASETDKLNGAIVNEAFVRAAGLTDPIGTQIRTNEYFDKDTKTIVGVVKDFHFGSLRERIQPLVMIMNYEYGESMLIRIEKDKQREGIAALERAYKKALPTAVFEYHFMDEINARECTQEQRWKKIIGIATLLSILICGLGLLGLAHLAVSQRMKEISIRKVLGASIANVASLLSKDFLKLVIAGVAIASPVAWWTMNRWLENFVYRIEIQWWMFALAGLMAIVIALMTVSSQPVKAALRNPVNNLKSD